jgi:copper chaperone
VPGRHPVAKELNNIGGASDVTADLVPGGLSAVTVASDVASAAQLVMAALDEAGDCQLAGS